LLNINIFDLRVNFIYLTVKKGGPPISATIRQSVLTFKEYSANNKKIILVTECEEDKGGDYVAECKKAKSEGITFLEE